MPPIAAPAVPDAGSRIWRVGVARHRANVCSRVHSLGRPMRGALRTRKCRSYIV
jgi:hypothetical protein